MKNKILITLLLLGITGFSQNYPPNKMVSFTDATILDYSLKLNQSNIYSNKLMTRSEAETKYDLSNNSFSGYLSNQLVPKSAWISLPIIFQLFEQPNGLALDSFGNLFVGNSRSINVSKITPQGVVTTTNHDTYPEFVTVDNNNNLYSANNYSKTIVKETSTGAKTSIKINKYFFKIEYSSGFVYFLTAPYVINSEYSSSQLYRLLPNNTYELVNSSLINNGNFVTDNDYIYLMNYAAPNITKYNKSTSQITTISTNNKNPLNIALGSNGSIYYVTADGQINKVEVNGTNTLIASGLPLTNRAVNYFIVDDSRNDEMYLSINHTSNDSQQESYLLKVGEYGDITVLYQNNNSKPAGLIITADKRYLYFADFKRSTVHKFRID